MSKDEDKKTLSKNSVTSKLVSRRGFMKWSGVLGGSLLIPEGLFKLLKADTMPARYGGNLLDVNNIPTATHWGMINVKLQGGRMVEALPFSKDPYPTPMIGAFSDRVYSKNRINYPAVRKSFLKNPENSDTSKRGKEEFVRVSWDEAFDLVAKELQRIRTQYGNPAIFTGTSDWQSVGLLNSASALVRRMLNLIGGFTDSNGDPSVAAAMVILPHVMGGIEVYDEQTAWPTIQDKTELLILLGADLLKDDQIGTHPSDHYAYDAIKKFKEKVSARKAKVVVIDPRFTDTAKYLEAEWIAPRPNTDTALMLGIAYVLYTEGLYNKDFIKKYTNGFDLFLPYLLGKNDGQPKTPEWAQSITHIEASVIKNLAREMTKKRTMIISGYAIQRADHGEQPYWMLVTLASMIGQIGLPGGGFGVSYHYDNGGDLVADAPNLPGISAGDNPVKNALPFERVADMFLHPGEKVPYNGTTYTYPDIKLVYWAGGNPMTHLWHTNKEIEAWRHPQTVIIQDIFWTPSAKFADIVLPATTTFERNDIEICGAYSHQYIVAMKKIIDPLFDSKSDYDIMAGIASRFGLKDKFTEGKTEMDWIRSFYDVALKQAKALHLQMPDFETFWEQGYVEFPIPEKSRHYVRYADFIDNPALNPLGTPSGKIEIYSKTIESFHYDDCPPHPTWLEPIEWLGSPLAKEYPLHLLSPHPRYRLHSQLDNTWIREWYEVHQREPLEINPVDAKSRGINDGDVVRVFNKRGEVLAGAVVTDRVREGVVVLHEGAWYDPENPGEIGSLDKHGLANVLTLDKGTSKLAQGNIANTALVQVEKYNKELPSITAFTPPKLIRKI